MEDELTIDRLAEVIGDRRTALAGKYPLIVLWHQVATDRKGVAEGLRQATAGSPIVSLVAPKDFTDENAVMYDLCQLIDENRAAFAPPLFPSDPFDPPVTLVLVSRSPLSFDPTGSSAMLPEWFPGCGGKEITAWIEDLRWTAMGPLDVEEARVSLLCERLYELDVAMVDRWTKGRQSDANRGDHLFTLMPELPNPNVASATTLPVDAFLLSAEDNLKQIRYPGAFRPSAKSDTPSLVGRLANLASRTCRNDLIDRSKVLADALGLPPGVPPPDDSLVTVLARTANTVPDLRVRFARNLMITLSAAYQFSNAKAHGDRAPDFPITLIQGFSGNLRNTLRELVRCLKSWPV